MEFTKFLYHLKITSWNQSYTKLFTKEIGFTEIFQKVVIQKFRKIRSESSTVVWKNEEFSLAENFFREIVAQSTHCGSYENFVSRLFEKFPWKQFL